MGRTVSYLSGATMRVYVETDVIFEEEMWHEDIESLRELIIGSFPSFEREDRWGGREDFIILENRLCEIAVSEYCGLVCISGRALPEHIGLGENFLKHVEKMLEEQVSTLRKVGVFSNGEAIFERI